MKKIALLGSTGSIGTSTLQVIRHLKDEVEVVALSAYSNIDLLQKQADEFHVKKVAVFDKEKAFELKKQRPDLEVLTSMEGLIEVALSGNYLVSSLVGSIGLIPTLEAIKQKKTIGLANKEILVCAGKIVMDLVKQNGVSLLPIDSEHSAIFQCLQGSKDREVSKLILTASGGPFRNYSQEELLKADLSSALNHPTWKMGAKITVDSSTLMNKGLEVIEARWLFDMAPKNIEVVIHPQSIIHSMVEFIDGSILAQMSEPSMILPIQYALTYPLRKKGMMNPFDFKKIRSLDFNPPDLEKFRCLKLAIQAIEACGAYPCFLNAANEVLVNRFLNKEISWYSIGQKLETLMAQFEQKSMLTVEEVLQVDLEARRLAQLI
jgi:1-deoxy-D-xylulose-5-phosphate reductoisomerase